MITVDKYRRLPLRTLKHRRVHYNQIIIDNYLKQLESLSSNFDNLKFAETIIQTTPKIELTETTSEAYDFIRTAHDIDKDSIKKLYDILSREELDKEEIQAMGKYYRKTIEFMASKSNFL